MMPLLSIICPYAEQCSIDVQRLHVNLFTSTNGSQCVSLKPTWGKGYSRLGAAYFGLEDWSEAVKAYEQGQYIKKIDRDSVGEDKCQ
jgi:hypothetical protein